MFFYLAVATSTETKSGAKNFAYRIYCSLITWAMAYVLGKIIQENNLILFIDSHNKSHTPVF